VSELENEFALPGTQDYEAFDSMHGFDDGFSIFTSYHPQQRAGGKKARDKERHWFYHTAPNYTYKVHDVEIQFHGDVAFATLYVDLREKSRENSLKGITRGTVIFRRTSKRWRILHEHWSPLDEDMVIAAQSHASLPNRENNATNPVKRSSNTRGGKSASAFQASHIVK
jgi:ketosteroid isomerase-like protein